MRSKRLVFSTLTLLVLTASVGRAVDILAPATTVTVERSSEKLIAASAKDAVAKAQAGDVIVLGPGTHFGPLVVSVSNVTLRGETGARVTANVESWKRKWTQEPAYGPFAYSASIGFEPVTVSIDQRVMINAEERRGGLSVHQFGAGRNGRAALGGVFTYVAKEKKLIVSFATDLDPTKHLIEAAAEQTSAVTIKDADKVTVKNLILTGGMAGLHFTNTNDSVVEGCLIYGADSGVRFGLGANDCKMIGNDITWNEDSLHADCDAATADVGNDVWHAHKKYGTYDKFGVEIDRTGDHNEIAGNYIYNVWNGITNGDGIGKDEVEAHYKNEVFKGITTYNKGLKVHHNRIDLTMDDALEPGESLVDNEWYSNVVTRGRCGTRFKTITHGPFFYYNNTIVDCGDGLRLYKSMPTSANVYIFNNFVKFSTAIIYHEMGSVAWDNPWLKENMAKGTPSFYVFNNAFVCKTPFANNMSENVKAVKPNFKGDYNLFTSAANDETKAAGIDAHSLFEADPVFVDPAKGDYHLQPGSPGKGEGKPLGELPIKVKLPAALQSDSAKPNMGLLDSDSEKAPTGPVTQLWAIAKDQFNLGERDVTQYSLTPLRWIAGPAADFVLKIDGDPAGSLPITFVRSDPAAKAKFKVTISDNAGATLLSRDGKPADKDGFTVEVPLKDTKQLKIHIDDEKDAMWRIETAGAQVGIAAAGALPLRKYDGAGYVFQYTVPNGTPAFGVTYQSKYPNGGVEIVRPDGSTEKLTRDNVTTNGVAGVYQIVVNFTKAAEITLDGPQPVLFFSEKPKPIKLKPMWGKPGY